MPPLRIVWAGSDPAETVQAASPREKKGEKTMARRKLTLSEQLKGVRAALRAKRTPPQLLAGLRKREKWLKDRVHSR